MHRWGGGALGIKLQINSLPRPDEEDPAKCKSYILICDGLLPAPHTAACVWACTCV